MDFRLGEENQGGSDGCVNFQDPDNGGLQRCLTDAGIPELYAKHDSYTSLADFIVIIAEAAMSRAHISYDAMDPFKDGTLA